MASRSLLAVAGAAFASAAGAAAGFTPGLAANAVTTAAPMASAQKPAASWEADI